MKECLLNPSLRRLRSKRIPGVLIAMDLSSVLAQETANPAVHDGVELAQKLSNPVADLISMRFPSNFEFGGGADDAGFRYLLNFQPVIPVSLNTN